MAATRRSFLKNATAAGAGLSKPGTSPIVGFRGPFGKADFHFLHLTDLHVRRKRKGHDGYAWFVEAMNQLKPAPDLILMGGDLVFDGNYTVKAEYQNQLELYASISARLPM